MSPYPATCYQHTLLDFFNIAKAYIHVIVIVQCWCRLGVENASLFLMTKTRLAALCMKRVAVDTCWLIK